MDDNTSVKIMYEDLREQAAAQFKEDELKVLDKAFQVANEKHKEQKRSSGEPYIIHPVSVAKIVLDYGMDCASVVAALLHDTVEDTDLTLEELDEIFGEEITHLVDGLTKLGKVPLDIKDKEEQQAENVRKMLLAMSQDIRIIIVKLADRLHNIRTLNFVAPQKRRDKALETLEIYAPIAHRLGIRPVKEELEDLAIKHLDPIAYKEIEESLLHRKQHREQILEEIKEKIKEQSIFNEPFIAPDVEGKEILDLKSKRRYLFRQQTIFVATHCHFLLSLWNGETQNESFDKISGAMLGCGAFNAVQFALKNNYNHWYDSEFGVDSQCFVCWIKTPRQGEKYNKCDVKTTFLHTADNNGFYNEFKIMGITSVEQSDKLPENLLEILVKTNLYNEDYYKYCKDEEKKQRKNFINWLKRVKKSIKSIFKKKKKDQKKESSPDDKYLIGKVEYENGGERMKRIHDCCKISSNLSQKEKKSFFTSVKLLGLCGFIFLILLLELNIRYI